MAGIHLVTGDNAPEKEAHIKELLEKTLPKETSQSGLIVYHAAEAPADDIVAMLSTSSIFSDSVCILIRASEEMASDTLKTLAKYIRNPSPQNTLILEGTKIGTRITATHPFHQAIKQSSGEIEEEVFSTPPTYKIPEWIVENASRRYKRRMDPDAAKLLQEFVGDDLLGLLNELEKMDVVLPKSAPIRPAEIKTFAGQTRAHKPWDLPHPVARKELATSLEILKNLFDYNTPSVQILYGLGDHFLRLLHLKLYFTENPDTLEQAKRLSRMGFKGKDQLNPLLADAANSSGYAPPGRPIRPNNVYTQITLPRVLDQVEHFSLSQLYYIVKLLATSDCDLKTGQMSDALFSMEKLIYYIIFSDKYRVSTKF